MRQVGNQMSQYKYQNPYCGLEKLYLSTPCTMMNLTLLKAKSNSFVHSIFAFLGKCDRAVKGARIRDLLGHMSL